MYNTNQFGFRSNRGTTLALITEEIAQNKSDKGQCQVILTPILICDRGERFHVTEKSLFHVREFAELLYE